MALKNNANGTKITLFTSEPFATSHTTGNSRLGFTPLTCSAFNAKSSPNTPAVFFIATLDITDTSSMIKLMSSNNANKLTEAIITLKITD